jgi:sulfur relay (sulfurtransferase) complex TusBCD TusD component (DsrE family)
VIPAAASPSTLIVINKQGMGEAESELRLKLLTTYLTLLDDNDSLPGAICFYTDGVKLALEGSPVLKLLQSLESKGVRLILCKTCLDYFGIADEVAVGIVGGMTDIISAQWAADKIITL